MRFRADSTPSAGIRVLPEVPDGALLRLEGRNGIGKTLLIRLLELTTGGQPFEALPQAWANLKKHLGATTLHIDGIRDGPHTRTIRVELDPEGWGSRIAPVGDSIGKIFLDDRLIDSARLSRYLKVYRIAADESLTAAMAASVRVDLGRIQELDTTIAPTMHRWDQNLESAARTARATSLTRVEALASRLAEARTRLKGARETAQLPANRLQNLRGMMDIEAQVETARVELPALDREAADLDEQEARAAAALNHLDSDLGNLLARQAKGPELRRRLEQVGDLLAKRKERLRRRDAEVSNAARRARVSPDIDVAVPMRTLRARQGELIRNRAGMGNAPRILDLSARLLPILGVANSQGLGPEIVAEASWGELAVDELQDAIRTHSDRVRAQLGASIASVESELADLQARLTAADELAHALRLQRVARADIEEATGQIADLLASSPDAHALAALQDRREALVNEITLLRARHTEIEGRRKELLGAGSVGELQERLLHIWQKEFDGPWEPETLHSITSQAEGECESLQDEVESASSEVREIQRLQDLEKSAVERALATLSALEIPTLATWAKALGRSGTSTISRVQSLDTMARGIDDVRDKLTGAQNLVEATTDALASLIAALTHFVPRQDQPPAEPLEVSVRRHYESVFTRELSEPTLRDALFDGGQNLAIELGEMRAIWTARDGTARSRPLEAFSSGERAFAYTRVRLEQLAMGPKAANTAVFLDEFGAFLAQEQFADLKRFLEHRGQEVADQICVILPLQGAAPPDALLVEDTYFVTDL